LRDEPARAVVCRELAVSCRDAAIDLEHIPEALDGVAPAMGDDVIRDGSMWWADDGLGAACGQTLANGPATWDQGVDDNQ
tara:strand:+ start:143 stop:382 length:240 start_codon:yes stop_codon:yes gene_type:complete